jgi:hypothetical protein
MALPDNNQNRGKGNWQIHLYNPSEKIGPISGTLIVGKDFHVVYADDRLTMCLANVPSQNVAYVLNLKD